MLTLLTFALISTCFTASESSIIYSAQCLSKCLTQYKDDIPNFQQCSAPCLEKNSTKLRLCRKYCKPFPNGGAPCHYSCKFIKQLRLRGILPGRCTYHKNHEGKSCNRYNPCTGLTKCCYDQCEEISLHGGGVTVAVNDITSSSLLIHWNKSNITNAVYILQMRVAHSTSIYFDDSHWGEWLDKWLGPDLVAIRMARIHSGAQLQFRVAVANSTGLQNIGPATPVIRTLFNASRPSGPHNIRVSNRTFKRNKVDVMLSWSPPQILDVPVHRYRLFWKERPQITSDRFVFIKKRTYVLGTQLNYTIEGLKLDKTYRVEVQAICLWKKKRLKSPKVALNVSTYNTQETQRDKIIFVGNTSNVSKKGSNSSIYQGEEIDKVEVIVENSGVNPQVTSQGPSVAGADGRSCGGGRRRPVLILMAMLLALFIYL